MIGVTQDITERKQTEQALRQSEERFRTVVEYAPEAVVLLDLQTRKFVEANTNAERLFRMTKEALLEVAPEDLSPARQPNGEPSKELALRLDGLAAEGGEVPPFEWVFRNSDGAEIPCEVRLVRLFLGGRTVVRGSVIDISERKELEERLAASQRMDAVGQLTSGVAHEFNNLLSAMMTNLQTLRRHVGRDSEIAPLVEATIGAGWRGAGITKSLLAFVRKQPLRAQRIDVRKLIAEMTEMLRGPLGDKIEIRVVLPPRLWRLEADPGLLQAALVNLALNARDAMPKGGQLTIEAASVRIAEADATTLKYGPDETVSPGRYPVLSVSDTGCGIGAELLPRVFEPFFTTKEVGQGTGLGLSAVYGFAKQSNGYVNVVSQVGRGTRMELALPVPPARKIRTASPASR